MNIDISKNVDVLRIQFLTKDYLMKFILILLFFSGCSNNFKCNRHNYKGTISFPYGITVNEYISINDNSGEIFRFYLDTKTITIQEINYGDLE